MCESQRSNQGLLGLPQARGLSSLSFRSFVSGQMKYTYLPTVQCRVNVLNSVEKKKDLGQRSSDGPQISSLEAIAYHVCETSNSLFD